jgi:hypothetical protein
MHDDRPGWFACLAWLSLVGGGVGGTHSLGQSVGNWRKLGIGGINRNPGELQGRQTIEILNRGGRKWWAGGGGGGIGSEKKK